MSRTNAALTLWNATLNLLLPPRCAGTGAVVDAPGMLSPAFWQELSFIDAPFCSQCGLPFGFQASLGTLCAACIDFPPAFDRARAAVAYNDASRKLVIDFKYGDRLHAVQTFTPWLMRAGAELLETTDIILPVPLHRMRLWQRRYNQSALLVAELAKRAGKAFAPDGLMRLRHTPKQKGLSKKERLGNVKNAFAANPLYTFHGKTVMIVDDVFTSGATLNECARTLKKAGAAQVYVLTIARVTRDENLS